MDISFHPLVWRWFKQRFDWTHAAAAEGLVVDREWEVDAHCRSDGLGKNLGGLSLVHRSVISKSGQRSIGRHDERRLCLSAQGSRQ